MKHNIKTMSKKIICELLSLCLCMALTAIILMTSVGFGFFRDSVFLQAMSDMNYYEELAAQLQDDLEQVVATYHIPETAVRDVIRPEQVYLDGYENLTHAIRGKSYEADITHVTEDLQERLDTYAEEHDIQTEQAVQSATQRITHAMSQEYGRMLSFPFASAYYNAKQTYEQMCPWIYGGCTVSTLICGGLLLLLHHKKYHGMRQIDHAVLAATITGTVIGGMVANVLLHMEILNEQNAYAVMIRNYFTGALYKGIWSLITGVAVWFVLLIVTKEMREKGI